MNTVAFIIHTGKCGNEALNIPTVTYPLQPISRSVLGVLRLGPDVTGFVVTSSRFVCKIRI
jgi:hypothetical protein